MEYSRGDSLRSSGSNSASGIGSRQQAEHIQHVAAKNPAFQIVAAIGREQRRQAVREAAFADDRDNSCVGRVISKCRVNASRNGISVSPIFTGSSPLHFSAASKSSTSSGQFTGTTPSASPAS